MRSGFLRRASVVHGIIIYFFVVVVYAKSMSFGASLCQTKGYHCHIVDRKERWGSLFPDYDDRYLIQKINRMNDFLNPGTVLAIPDTLEGKNIFDFSPFVMKDTSFHENTIVIDHQKRAWAAYNDAGVLLLWGPVAVGSIRCFEDPEGCETPTGHFRIYRIQGKDCTSGRYPQLLSGEYGGAAMPYCLFFHKGYAIHGGSSLSGSDTSHGCVRLFPDDAKWLFYHFAKIGTAVRIE